MYNQWQRREAHAAEGKTWLQEFPIPSHLIDHQAHEERNNRLLEQEEYVKTFLNKHTTEGHATVTSEVASVMGPLMQWGHKGGPIPKVRPPELEQPISDQ